MIKFVENGNIFTSLLVLGALVLLLLFGLPLVDTPVPSLAEISPKVPRIYDDQAAGNPNQDHLVTIDDIVEDPNIYLGLTVTIEGEVADWVTRNAFALGSPEFLGNITYWL